MESPESCEKAFIENVTMSGRIPSCVDLGDVAALFPPLHYFQPQLFAVAHSSQMPYLFFRLTDPESVITLSESGEFMCTGANSIKDALQAVEIMLRKLSEVGILRGDEVPKVQPAVHNIVSTARVGDHVILEKALKELKGGRFDPASFPGIVYRIPGTETTVTVFRSGRITITGTREVEETLKTARSVRELLSGAESISRKTSGVHPSGRVDVAVIRSNDPHAAVLEALSLIHAEKVVSREDKVLIKPNYIVAKHPSTGVTTDTRVIEALIKFVKKCGCKDITVADGGGGKGGTEATFNVVGIKPVVKRHGVRLVDLNRDETAEVDVPYSGLGKMNIARTVMESDCIINAPCLKSHELGLVTLSFKNLVGVAQPHGALHKNLHENVVGLAALLKPALNVISGIIGNEGHQVHGNPVEMGLVIASTDIVATDTVGAEIMDVEPDRVRHIWLGKRYGLGVGDLGEINVLGEPIDAVRRRFRSSYAPSYPPSLETIRSWGVANWDYHILAAAGAIEPGPRGKRLAI